MQKIRVNDEWEVWTFETAIWLNEAVNKEDVANIIYEEFLGYFGGGVIKPKGHAGYMAMADEIWNVWSLK